MREKSWNKFEIFANIALIAVALLLVGFLVKRYLIAESFQDEITRRSAPQISAQSETPLHDMNAANLNQMIVEEQRVVVLDVRDRNDYSRNHISRAVNIPFDELEVRASNELSYSDMIVIYCRCTDDGLSRLARQTLDEQGFSNVLVLQGGLDNWVREGLPVISQ